ncbi:MAG: acyltransferase family protein [Cyanobacteriota bacterium]
MGLLRLALAICVFYAHTRSSGIPVLRAEAAVEIFYIISGFYMQLILANVYTPARLGKGWLLRFYTNRYIRLYPTYIIVATATIAFAAIYTLLLPGAAETPLITLASISELKQNLPNTLLKAYILLTNMFMLFQDASMFMGVRDGTAQLVADFSNSQIQIWQALAVPQAWSIGIELSFYLAAPFLLRLSSKILTIVIIASFTCKAIFMAIATGHSYTFTGIPNILPNAAGSWGYRFLPFEIAYFLSGSLAYRYYENTRNNLIAPTPISKILGYFFVIASVTIASLLFNIEGLCWIYPFMFAGFVPLLFSLFRSSPQDRAIGNLSYPFYMLHMLCIRISSPLAKLEIPGLSTTAAFLITLLLSAALIKGEGWIEKERLKIKSSAA